MQQHTDLKGTMVSTMEAKGCTATVVKGHNALAWENLDAHCNNVRHALDGRPKQITSAEMLTNSCIMSFNSFVVSIFFVKCIFLMHFHALSSLLLRQGDTKHCGIDGSGIARLGDPRFGADLQRIR